MKAAHTGAEVAYGEEKELSFIGSACPPHAVLPGGLPGFGSLDSIAHLMPKCPRGGKGPAGEHHGLLVSTRAYFAESREEKTAMLRLAVHVSRCT